MAVAMEQCMERPELNDRAASQIEADIARALRCLEARQFDKAEALYTDLLRAAPFDAALMTNRGIARFEAGRWQDALTDFEAAEFAGSNHPVTLCYRARSLHAVGRAEDAIEYAQRWVEAARSSDREMESRAFLALLYSEAGQDQQAQHVADAVLAEDPGNDLARLAAGQAALALGDDARAREHFEANLRQDQGNGRAWLGMGLLQLRDGSISSGIDGLRRAISIYPDNVGYRVTLGWACIAQQDWVAARQAFDEALAVNPKFGECHGGLATVLVALGDIEGARHAVRVARRLSPGGFGAEFANALILTAEGAGDSAQAKVEELLRRVISATSDPTLLDRLRTRLASASVQQNESKQLH
jgi:protein O-GlcNAc transferase